MTPSLKGWPTKAKEAPSPHEVRLALLDTNPIFHSLEGVKEFSISIFKFQYSNVFLFLMLEANGNRANGIRAKLRHHLPSDILKTV